MENQNLTFCRLLFMMTKAESAWKGGRLCTYSQPALFQGGDRWFEVFLSRHGKGGKNLLKKYPYPLWQGYAANAWDAKTQFLNEFEHGMAGSDFIDNEEEK